MKNIFLLLFLFVSSSTFAQEIQRIEPMNWWTNMPVDELQILIYSENIGEYRASLEYDGIEIIKQISVDSPNYLFLYLKTNDRLSPGFIDIALSNGSDKKNIQYEIKRRENRAGLNQGFGPSDVIYLMMPDRFANGDTSNDSVPGMLESADRDNPERRQGGDIQGVLDHLDYIENLGMTSIWFTPIFENDMSANYGAYHGYAATDLYKVDRRFGSNELYKELVETVHSRGMKVIMDMIHNHIGDNHWWMKDLPTADWVHNFEKYGQTNFRGSVVSDPYSSRFDREKLTNGWFVPEMPDLNQDNELLSDYLIQNTIWWIEYSGVDGIRMDTYVYPDKEYMAEWSESILKAYPDFNIVGEAWVNTVSGQAYWQKDLPGVDDGYNSNLPSLTDFNFAFSLREAFIQDFGWESGISRLYYFLSQDFLFSDPMMNVTFMDNHDMSRFFEHIGRDEDYFRMAYAYLMTTRGTPQVYYGTELMMGHENRGGDDEVWRQTMPGGWPDDVRTVFTEEGRTEKENEIFNYIRKLTQWRKTAEAIHSGKLVHFIPENNSYIYFRIHENQTVMVIMNASEEEITINSDRFKEILSEFYSGRDIINGTVVRLNNIKVNPKTATILELVRNTDEVIQK